MSHNLNYQVRFKHQNNSTHTSNPLSMDTLMEDCKREGCGIDDFILTCNSILYIIKNRNIYCKVMRLNGKIEKV